MSASGGASSRLVGFFILAVWVSSTITIEAARDTPETAATTELSANTTSYITGDCPDWLKNYEEFHATSRGQPGAKYLVHQVPDFKQGKSGGFGDRLRGMLYALRLAVASQRVLLFTWARPVELHHMLQPAAAMNWTLDGITGYNPEEPGTVYRFMNGAHHADVLGGKLVSLGDEFITVQTNQRMDAACYNCPPLPDMDPSTACVWNRLFKPVDAVQQTAEAELQRLYNSTNPTYVAIHLRLGGFTGEQEHERGSGPLKNFAGAIRCANMLAVQHNVSSSAPLLLITDNHHLRTFIKGGNLPNIVTPDTQPVHIDQALNLDHNVKAHQSTVIDLELLSRAVCLVTSPGYKHPGLSGFSHHGWLHGGGKSCNIDFRKCI